LVSGGVNVDQPGLGHQLDDVVDVVRGCMLHSHGVAKLLDGVLEVVESMVVVLKEFGD